MKGLEQRAREYTAKIFNGATPSEVVKAYMVGATEETRELKRELEEERFVTEGLKKQIEKMKSDVLGNIKWADQNKNNQMYCKLNTMINQWEIKEK